MAYLANVWRCAAMPRIALRPSPRFQIPETSGTDHCTVAQPDDRKRFCGSRIPPRNCCFEVDAHTVATLRQGSPSVKRRIYCGGFDQSVDMMAFERFEPDVFASQDFFSMSFGGYSEIFLPLHCLVASRVCRENFDYIAARCESAERKQFLKSHLAGGSVGCASHILNHREDSFA